MLNHVSKICVDAIVVVAVYTVADAVVVVSVVAVALKDWKRINVSFSLIPLPGFSA